MVVHVKLSQLKQGHWYEYLVRFVLGGLVTVVAGAVADIWGPAAGGLFLAFPAIFCASATLIETHEHEEKAKKHLRGQDRGKKAAALDARGALLGSVALAAFGGVMWLLAQTSSAGSIAIATLVWFVLAVLLWHIHRKMRAANR
ncbi:MAG: DUF3147 family protein [Bradyrhizobium sp.]